MPDVVVYIYNPGTQEVEIRLGVPTVWQVHGEPGLLETLSYWELISKTSALSMS